MDFHQNVENDEIRHGKGDVEEFAIQTHAHAHVRNTQKNHMQAKVNHTNPSTNKMHSVKSPKILHKNVNVVIRGLCMCVCVLCGESARAELCSHCRRVPQ